MPVAAPPPEIEKIFLSATAKDSRDFRPSLKQAVEQAIAAAKIQLQEYWTDPAGFVVEICRDRLRAQDAYFGVFGHRHGWVPPGHTESITALEFAWAVERWPVRMPPIFVMLPEPGSAADEALRRWADDELAKEHADEAAREASRARQRAFVDTVRRWAGDDGRFLVQYGSEQQLREKGLACVLNWNLAVLKMARDGRRESAGGIPGDELGRIGRDDQIGALDALVDALRARPASRWAAVAVHGAPNHGQRAFADRLASWDGWDDADGVLDGQPPHPEDPAALARWACGLLRHPLVAGREVDALAERLAARLDRGDEVVVIVRAFGAAADRWRRFADGFWRPLTQSLSGRVGATATGRLLWIVVDHEVVDVADAAVFGDGSPEAADADPARIVPLPELKPITAAQVQAWLKSLKSQGIKLDHARRVEVAAAATTPDGRPVDVYDRLERLNVWIPEA